MREFAQRPAERLHTAMEAFAHSHGGAKQRLEAALVTMPAPTSNALDIRHSHTCEELVLDYGLGLLSSVSVGRYAGAALADVQQFKQYGTISELEQLGSMAHMNRSHCARKIRSIYSLDDNHMPEPYIMKLPFWDAKARPPQVV